MPQQDRGSIQPDEFVLKSRPCTRRRGELGDVEAAAHSKKSGPSGGEPRHEGGEMQSSKRQRIEAGHGQEAHLDQVHAPVPLPVATAAHPKDGRDDEDPEASLNAAMLRARMLMATASERKAAPTDEALSRQGAPALAYQGYSPPYMVEAGEGSGIPPPPPIVALEQEVEGAGGKLFDPSRATELVSAELEPAPVSCVPQIHKS
jgi:hypothetical protein